MLLCVPMDPLADDLMKACIHTYIGNLGLKAQGAQGARCELDRLFSERDLITRDAIVSILSP